MTTIIKQILGSLAYMSVLGAIMYLLMLLATSLVDPTGTSIVFIAIFIFLGVGYGGWKFATKVLFKDKSPW